jgi:hypothetical protein
MKINENINNYKHELIWNKKLNTLNIENIITSNNEYKVNRKCFLSS